MRLSEAIKELQAYHDEFGDLELVSIHDTGTEFGMIVEYGVIFEPVGIPGDAQGPDEAVIALMEPICIHKKNRNLHVVKGGK